LSVIDGTPIVFVALVAALAVAVAAYWLRCRYRFWYGVLEIAAGLAVVFLTIYPETNYFLLDTKPFIGQMLRAGVGVLAGIYIIVRGFDNLDADLPVTWRGAWDRWFPKR
jgi:hypothetical protein